MYAIHRYPIPVDDVWHEVVLGDIVHVDCRTVDTVDVWATTENETARRFRVYGTGQPIADTDRPVGTALSARTELFAREQLVWHLVEEGP